MAIINCIVFYGPIKFSLGVTLIRNSNWKKKEFSYQDFEAIQPDRLWSYIVNLISVENNWALEANQRIYSTCTSSIKQHLPLIACS